jgi:hypothetical protein
VPDLRLYRVTLLPFVIGVVIVAFSLHTGPTALTGSQPGATFAGSEAHATMTALASAGGDPAPGSPRDDALARQIARRPPPYGLAHAGFQSVRVVRTSAQTTAGQRTVETVIATRFGTGPGIVLIADRGGQGGASSLAATATLLEIARVFRELSTQRPLTLVSTSGGASGIESVAGQLPAAIEGAIVIGVPPSAPRGAVSLIPWSTAGGLAPAALRVTLEAALTSGLRSRVGDVPLADQLARLAWPLTTGAQGPVLAAGIPAVLATATAAGEAAQVPAAAPAPDAAALGAFGQSLVAATTALDQGPDLTTAPVRDLSVGSQILDGWGVRLLVGLLLASLAVCTLDVLARAQRRRADIAGGMGWVLSLAVPFLLAGVFAIFLGSGSLLRATPAAPVTTAQLPIGSSGLAALISIGLVFVLTWALRAAVRRRRPTREPVGCAAAVLATACMVAFLLWLANPYTALLLIVPLHVWLVALTREHGRPPLLGLLVFAASLALPVAALALVCSGVGISAAGFAWTLVLLTAGGGLPFAGLLLGAVACGCAVGAGALLLAPAQPAQKPAPGTQRPFGYMGPGSLGGTQSALRR